jgi:hypothetical protein
MVLSDWCRRVNSVKMEAKDSPSSKISQYTRPCMIVIFKKGDLRKKSLKIQKSKRGRP